MGPNKQRPLAWVILLVSATLFKLSSSTCPSLLERPPLPTPVRSWGNMCVVSMAHKFVWLPIPKTGSSTVRNILVRALCCPVTNRTKACQADAQLVMLQTACPSHILQTVNCGSIFSGQVFKGSPLKSDTFLYFSVARNPFIRGLSSWNYGRLCYNNNWKGKEHFGSSHPPYPTLLEALSVTGNKTGYENLPIPFLKWFDSAHLGPQAPFLIDAPSGRPAVNMILRTEQLHADLLCLFKQLGLLDGLGVLKSRPGNLRHFAQNRCKFLGHARALYAFYRDDFALLEKSVGFGQISCNETSEAVIVGEGCNCPKGELFCLCNRPTTFQLKCDTLSCSTDFTAFPCQPQLCAPESGGREINLSQFA